VRNTAIDAARRRKSEQNALAQHEAPQFVEPVDPVAGAEEAARINAALLELPQDQRETLLLKLYGPFTFEDMAEVVGAPAKTVMSRYRLALEKLNKALAEPV
jgi:RNA polymerase sigma-70 factor (ECF subfamily)